MLIGKNKMLIITIILILIIISIYLIYNRPIYGNNESSIIEVIKSIEKYESGTIEILEIKDIEEERAVGFLYNSSPAYIHFYKNSQGNYKWRHIEKRDQESFSLFHIYTTTLRIMIVTNS